MCCCFFLGIVEENEDCDCGFYYDCIENDMCCIPRDSKGPGCKVKLNEFQCHPSQGLCCSESCQFKDLSSFGLVKKLPFRFNIFYF